MDQRWMLFLAVGFIAGAIFGTLVFGNIYAKDLANANCGVCQENLDIMINNFDVMMAQCHTYSLPKGNSTVMGYAT